MVNVNNKLNSFLKPTAPKAPTVKETSLVQPHNAPVPITTLEMPLPNPSTADYLGSYLPNVNLVTADLKDDELKKKDTKPEPPIIGDHKLERNPAPGNVPKPGDIYPPKDQIIPWEKDKNNPDLSTYTDPTTGTKYTKIESETGTHYVAEDKNGNKLGVETDKDGKVVQAEIEGPVPPKKGFKAMEGPDGKPLTEAQIKALNDMNLSDTGWEESKLFPGSYERKNADGTTSHIIITKEGAVVHFPTGDVDTGGRTEIDPKGVKKETPKSHSR